MDQFDMKRWASLILIAILVFWIFLSHQYYGLKAHATLQLSLIIPLLFSGVLLGRAAVWWVLGGLLLALLIGAQADFASGAAQTVDDLLNDLSQPVLACLIVALILDRLIVKLRNADLKADELDLVCDQLEIEIEENERSHAQLIHSQKMEAIGQLAGGIAHDFNNLLSVIIGYARDPLNDVSLDHATRSLGGIERVVDRGSLVTRRLLSLTRPVGRMKTFDLVATIDELHPLIRSLLPKHIQLGWEVPSGPIAVEMSQDGLQLAVLNIASNAKDAMPEPGLFSLQMIVEKGHVEIIFSDTGCGMSDEVVARIFEPFFTTKPENTGTGIGLSMVYQTIIEASGTVLARSQPGDGTTLSIRLPVASTASLSSVSAT